MSMLTKAIAAVLPLLAGCVVAVRDEPRHYHAPPPAETTVVVDAEGDEVHYVVYREYFGCSEAEIAYFPHYRHYYGLTDDDIYFIYYTSILCGVGFDVCFNTYYYECNRSYDRLVVYYRVPRERYFVAIGTGVSPPPVYARTYAAYRSGSTASVTFSNQEYVALVHLKVGVEYQGHPPDAYFARVKSTGSTGRVIVESRDQCGRGGRSATGGTVAAKAPRPWTMAPQQKQQWRQERQESATKAESPFREKHREQAAQVEREKGAPPKSERPKTERPPREADPPDKPRGRERSDPDRPPPVEKPDRGPFEKPPPKRPPPDRPKGDGKPPRGDEKGDKKDR